MCTSLWQAKTLQTSLSQHPFTFYTSKPSLINKLQLAQNNLARVVCQSRGRTDARLLHSLQWLPVRQRVTYELAVLAHKVRTTATPTYLSELVQTHAPPRALHSSDAPTLVVPRTHTHRTGPSRFFCCCSIHLELCLLTFDCAKTFSLSNATWKPIYSNSLSPPVLHQAPLYLRT